MPNFFRSNSEDSDESSSEEEEELSSGEESGGEQDKSEDSSSEESDEDEDEDDSDSSSDEEAQGVNRFLRKDVEDESSSSDEEKVTVVKSAKDKRFDELEGIVRLIENAEKIGDWAVISTGERLWPLRSGVKANSICRVRQAQPTASGIAQAKRWQTPKAVHKNRGRP